MKNSVVLLQTLRSFGLCSLLASATILSNPALACPFRDPVRPAHVPDAPILSEINQAVVGLHTTGNEGEPGPLSVVDFIWPGSSALDDQVILDQVLPRLCGFDQKNDPRATPGLESLDLTHTWDFYTAAPRAADYPDAQDLATAQEQAAKWQQLKTKLEQHLQGLRAVHMGYRFSTTGSLDTGAVGTVFVGRTPSGRVVAVYGIDIWT